MGYQNMVGFEKLIEDSNKFQELRKECINATKLSFTGITNLVVNHEDPIIVDSFLASCFKSKELYHGTYSINAIELQLGKPGEGNAINYLDQLIYGSFEIQAGGDELDVNYVIDNRTGERKRNADGFVNRKEVITCNAENKLLVIRNIDYCLDFCGGETGEIDSRALWLFDQFRNSVTRYGMRILLVTNKIIKFPFKVRTVEFVPVDDFEARHLLKGMVSLFKTGGKQVNFTESQVHRVTRKIKGLIYTEAGDVLGEAFHSSVDGDKLDSEKVCNLIRDKVNRNLLQDGSGLSYLNPKPWEDYICPESSNFTWDVKKILRDFEEVETLKKSIIKAPETSEFLNRRISAIRNRMPHVILLTGRGGIGKSAFAPHFAGLLGFDSWNFNIGASHSKWVGEGAERMRTTLDRVSRSSHVVCRIDEYDRAMGSGDSNEGSMHQAHRQVESEFMNWLQDEQEENNFVKNDIFIVMTTNHKENITGPLLRSGRIDLVIDIDKFDTDSMKKTYLTASRRMKNRGIAIVGFEEDYDGLHCAIEKLNLDKVAQLSNEKGFTVRDVDVLIQEMAAYDYYFHRDKGGFAWKTDTFVKVLENSTGSARKDGTAELILGDRSLLEAEAKVIK